MMNSYFKQKPAIIQLLIFIGMAIGCFMILSLIGTILIASMSGLSLTQLGDSSNWDYTDPAMLTFIRGMLVIQFIGLFIIPTALFSFFADPKPARFVGLKKPVAPVYLILGIVVLIVSVPLVEWLGLINQKADFPEGMARWMRSMEDDANRQIRLLLSKNSIADLLLNILMIAGFAAIGEELFFRGVLQRIFIRMFRNPWVGILVTAFVFSAFHFQFYGFLPRFLLGILLGAAYWYSGSLWTSILAHFFYNGLIIIIAYYNPELVSQEETNLFNASSILIPALVSLAAVTVIIWYMHKRSSVTFAEVYADDKKPTNEFPFS
jgi:uncharacterized protein